MKRRTRAGFLGVEPFEDRLVPASLAGATSAGVFAAPSPTTTTIITDITYLSPPALSSLPGASAKLYLDFNGNTEADWFIDPAGTHYVANTPAFDTDGHPGWLTGTEMGLITGIWKRVAEDFAPFNIDVTTIDPGDFSDKKGLHVVIGGSDADWLGLGTSGISSIGSFTSAAPNVVFVFSQDIVSWADGGVLDGDDTPMQIAPAVATTASHESGHSFGLQHQSLWSGGVLINAYNPGSSERTPIMGNNLCSDRTTWSYGASVTGAMQNDMSIIAGSANGFGYRPDSDNTFASATNLFWAGGKLSASGVIATTADKDYYRFDTTGGTFTFAAALGDVGPNLDVRLELWSHKPLPPLPDAPVGFADSLLASADPDPGLNASVARSLAAGTYYLVVRSHGEYGDVGQYTLQAEPFFFPIKTLSTGGAAPSTGPGTTDQGLPSLPEPSLIPGTNSQTDSRVAPRENRWRPDHGASPARGNTADDVAPRSGRHFARADVASGNEDPGLTVFDGGISVTGLARQAGAQPALYPH